MTKVSDEKIISAIKVRSDSKARLTNFSVACINGISDLKDLSEKTRMVLFHGLAANDDLYSYKFKLIDLVTTQGFQHSGTWLEHYQAAYNKLLPTLPKLHYSKDFATQVWQALEKTMLQSKFSGDWKTATLKEKIEHLNQAVNQFLDYYDPENHIHKNDIFNNNIVGIMNSPHPQTDKLNHAAQSPVTDNIFFDRYLIKYFDEKYIEENKLDSEVDSEGTRSATIDDLVPHTANFLLEKSKQDWHWQYNDPNVQFVTCLGNEKNSKVILSHELLHLVCFRLFRCYQARPKEIEKVFNFSEQDFHLHISSIIGYTSADQNREQYFDNREETTARKIENKFKRNYKPTLINPAP